MIFTRIARAKSTASTMALALAVATGAMVGSTVVDTPAFAAEKKAKANYSKEFVAAYKPLQALLDAGTPDAAAITAALPAAAAAATTDDDKFAMGSAYVNAAQKTNDLKLALTGLEMMLGTGKVPAENVGLYNFQAGQLAYKYEDYAKARTYLQAAIDAGYTKDNPATFIAESYFAEKNDAAGIAYLGKQLDAQKAAGQPIDEQMLKRALAMAYNSQLKDQAQKYAAMYVEDFPSTESWKDAIAIQLNTGGYQNPEILDLLRLGRRVGTLQDGKMYMEYVDAADYRRLPAEVVAVIEDAYAKNLIPKTEPYIADTYKQASTRAAADRADMAGLLKEGNAPGAPLKSVMAAGDALLSMGKAADAETFYAKAAGMPGADTAMALTRLGIAQFDQGKYAEAQNTFAKVQGARQAIANLWSIYAKEKAAGTVIQ